MSRLDGAELEVLRVVGEGRDKIAYEVRDPEHPEETFVVLMERDQGGRPSFHSDSDAIALLERDLRLFLEAKTVDPERVIRTCDQLINLDPRHELAYFHRGVMRSLRGDFAGAVADLTTATQLAPDHAINWFQLSAAALGAEHRYLALQAAERAAALDTMAVASYLASFPDVRDRLAGLIGSAAGGTGSMSALAAAFARAGDAAQLRRPPDRARAASAAIRWSRATDELQLPELPLLPPGTEVRISESSILSSGLPFFSAGYLLAVMHADGVVHGDFHPGNFIFQLSSGWTAPLDSSGGKVDDFSSLHAVYDFLAPCLSLDGPSLSAMLVGYGKALSVRSFLSSFVPEEVFGLLGADVDYTVRTDPEPGVVARLVQCLDMNVLSDPAPSVLVRYRDSGDLEDLLRRQPRCASALALVTTILHYDAAPLWEHLAGRLDRATPVGAFVAEIARMNDRRQQVTPTSNLGTELNVAHALIRALAAVTGVGGVVRTPSAEWPPGRVEGGIVLAPWVSSYLDATDPDGAIRTSPVIDDVLELVDAIALAWDLHPGQRWLSQSAAQVAQLLMRAVASEPRIDERRELAMAARHARLSWLALPDSRRTFGSEAAEPYVLDRLRTLRSLLIRTIPPRTSSEPIPQPGIHWSLAWRGLTLARESMMAYADRPEPDDMSFQIAVEFLGLYHEFLRQYLMALVVAFGEQFFLSRDFATLREEYDIVTGLFEGGKSLRDLRRSRWPEVQRTAARLWDSFRGGFLFDARLPALVGYDRPGR